MINILSPPEVANTAELLTGIKTSADKSNLWIQKAKALTQQTQRALTRAGDYAVDVSQVALQVAELWGIEGPEQKLQRLEVFSMFIDDVKQRLKEQFPDIRITGSRAQLRMRLLLQLRGETPTDEPDEEDTDETINADLKQLRDAKVEQLELQKKKIAADLKEALKEQKGSSSGIGSGLCIDKMKELYCEQVKDMHRKIDSFKPGDLVVTVYGTINGTSNTPGQGMTPGMPRALKIVEPKIGASPHLCLCERLEVGGAVPKQQLLRHYERNQLDSNGIARLTPAEWIKLKKQFKVEIVAATSAPPSVAPSTVSAETTPLASPRDVQDTAAGSVAASSGDSEVVINEATGKRLYGGARKAYLAKKARTS